MQLSKGMRDLDSGSWEVGGPWIGDDLGICPCVGGAGDLPLMSPVSSFRKAASLTAFCKLISSLTSTVQKDSRNVDSEDHVAASGFYA